MIDKRSGTVVSHRDARLIQPGSSLVGAFASQNKIIAIEQPEIPYWHFKPVVIFIESALGERKNRFLIETHSEHALRIMRRIRGNHIR